MELKGLQRVVGSPQVGQAVDVLDFVVGKVEAPV